MKTIPAQYAKAIAALAGQVLLFLQWKYGGGSEWVLLATSVATVLGVAGIKNAPKPAAGTTAPPG